MAVPLLVVKSALCEKCDREIVVLCPAGRTVYNALCTECKQPKRKAKK